MKRYTPKTLIKFFIKEFSFSLIIFFSIFLSLIFLITYIEEVFFFREKNIENYFYLKILLLTFTKTPSLIIDFSPFIFLFSGIFFYVKLIKNNELTPLSISGFSKNFITLVPAIYSFIIGIFIIMFLTPVSSGLSKYYESVKQKYNNNDNLLIISNTGLWVKENKKNTINIIRANKITNQNFDLLENLTIYKFDKNFNLFNRIDAKKALVKNNYWELINSEELIKKNKSNKNILETNINLNKLKNYYNKGNFFSIWKINDEIKKIKEIGYYGQELVVTLNKYLSLPFFLFSMIVLSTFFTLHFGQQFNNFIYIFLGILIGILIYFLSDLSIAIGKSGKIPLILSVWMPSILIMTISIYSLLKKR